MDNHAILAELEILITAIDEAGDAAQTGADVDLSGFDTRVEQVCDAAARAKGPGADVIAVRLEDLTMSLERTATALRDRLSAEDAAGHRQAAAAYSKPRE